MSDQSTSTASEQRPPRPRLRFVGPPGHPAVGRTLLAGSLTSSRLGVVRRMTEELGMTVQQVGERIGRSEPGDPWAFCVVIYLTLANAGFATSLAEVEDTFAFDDVEDGGGGGGQDPTRPPQQPRNRPQTGSGPAAGGGSRGGRRKRPSGSMRR